jgi:hypothetical protein
MREAVVRWCEHGESGRDGKSDKGCSGCVAGICGAALACQLPEDPFHVPSRWRRIVSAIKNSVREWKRRAWRMNRIASIQTPFD